MPAATFHFTDNHAIEQGATWAKQMVYKDSEGEPVDLTGYTARMQIRKTIRATVPAIELTTENGRITLGGDTGTIELIIAAEDTAALQIASGVYDLELVASDEAVTRFLEGDVEIKPEVTR